MSKPDKKEVSHDVLVSIDHQLKELGSLQKKSNKIARKRNRLYAKQYSQSLLDFELSERQYLIEKSKLQPQFRLHVSETLTCEPDFVNDPEQASEFGFLKSKGIAIDCRLLKVRIDVKGNTQYMHPNIVFSEFEGADFNGKAYSMSEYLYFISLNERLHNSNIRKMTLYFVYRDQTTLPVVHKYIIKKESNLALQRWSVAHMDTVYAKTSSQLLALESADECHQLFISRG